MGTFRGEHLDTAVVQELFDDINEHYLFSESALLQLDRQPNDAELINAIFRSVHTIKGDVGVVAFAPALPLMTAAENLLGLLRSGETEHSSVISDLVLLILDRVKTLVEQFGHQGYVDYDNQSGEVIAAKVDQVIQAPAEERARLLAQTIEFIDPSVAIASIDDAVKADQEQANELLASLGFDADTDIAFFRSLMAPIEQRSQFWQGRGDRILKLSLILNQIAGSPVDEKQLAVAVYAHDFGMAFMPLELLHKQTTLTNNEIILLRSHVHSGANILQHIEQWQQAREMVLQHHEASNGSGYPYGLREKEICDGAKILAVADSFDAMTHQRAYSAHQKRPIIRAVKEINDSAGKQLSPYWVDVFNQAVQPVLLAHRARQI